MMAGFNEARSRGAEYMDGYVLSDHRTSDITLRMHKEMGYVLIGSNLDYLIVDGKRIECTNYHLRKSLMTIADRKEYDGKKFSCDGGGTHPIVHFKYTPKYSHVRQLIDGELTAVCPYCDKDVIYNG